MNRKCFPVAVAFSLVACVVFAQDSSRPQRIAGGAPKPHLLPRGAEAELNLTEDQRKQVADLEAEAAAKLSRILTPAQLEKMEAMRRPPPAVGREERALRSAAPQSAFALPATVVVQPLPAGVTRRPVVFSNGHETVPVDHGRPVALIAAALGVKDEVFREAFSHVHPAGPGSGGPTDAEARANKAALMKALGKFGITDERINTVSNFYRYPPGSHNLWRNQPAAANALVKDGGIVGFEITSPGYGYTTPPNVSVPGMADVSATVKLAYGKDMEANGAVAEITLSQSR